MATPFEVVYEYVQDDIGKPELEDIITRRIKRAVMDLHRIDFFKRDLVEQLVAFQYTQSVQQIRVAQQFARLRAIAYIRKYNPAGPANADPSIFSGQAGEMFKEINPQQVFDGYGYDRRNSMYRTTDLININSSEPIQQILIGWFRDPLIEPIQNCDSWIMADYPNLVAARVKRRIFRDIGKEDEAKSADAEEGEQQMILLANNIRLAVLQQPGE